VKSNGKDGLVIKKIMPLMLLKLPTPDFHTPPLFNFLLIQLLELLQLIKLEVKSNGKDGLVIKKTTPLMQLKLPILDFLTPLLFKLDLSSKQEMRMKMKNKNKLKSKSAPLERNSAMRRSHSISTSFISQMTMVNSSSLKQMRVSHSISDSEQTLLPI
jgi:hypothetical protein